MKTNVLNLLPKLKNKNMFHDETRQAGVNLVQAAQFILDNDGLSEALFYINHVKEQLIKINEENQLLKKKG
jgi:hypothetical protein